MSYMSQSPKEASRDWAMEAKLFSLASTVEWMHTGPCPAPSLLVWCSCLSRDFVQQHRPRSWLWPPQPCSNCHPPVSRPHVVLRGCGFKVGGRQLGQPRSCTAGSSPGCGSWETRSPKSSVP